MKTIYICDDGTQFDDEYDAETYENKLKIKDMGAAILLNKKGEPTLDWERVSYIKVHSPEEAEAVYKYGEYYALYDGVEPLKYGEVGEYYYDDSVDRFEKISDKIANLEAELDFYKYIFDGKDGD